MFKFFLWVTVIFFILTFRLSIKISINYNLLKNKGTIIFKLYFIPIAAFNFDIQPGYFNFTKKNKTLKIKFDLSDKNIRYINDLKKYLLKNIYVTKFFLLISFQNNNAFWVTLINKLLNYFVYIFYYLNCHNNSDTKVEYINDFGFLNNKIAINLKLNLFVSILDLILGFLKAELNRRFVYANN